jgi:hypothetical protein
MARTPYKMKGNPMQRNYGIPLKNTGDHKHTDEAETKHPMSQATKVKITYNADGSVTRSKGGKTVTMEPNPEYDPKDGSAANQAKGKMRVKKT